MAELSVAKAHIWQKRPEAKVSPRKMTPDQFLEAYEMYDSRRDLTVVQILDIMREKYGDTVSYRRFCQLKRLHEDSIDTGGSGISIDMNRVSEKRVRAARGE